MLACNFIRLKVHFVSIYFKDIRVKSDYTFAWNIVGKYCEYSIHLISFIIWNYSTVWFMKNYLGLWKTERQCYPSFFLLFSKSIFKVIQDFWKIFILLLLQYNGNILFPKYMRIYSYYLSKIYIESIIITF